MWKTAVTNAHQGGHPGISGVKRRIRGHFWFPEMGNYVESIIKSCTFCMMNTEKGSKEPQRIVPVPDAPWQEVSVDLFGPMPDRKHVLVVQDLQTRFPCVKIVSSTGGKHVIPAMEEIYNNYGNPDTHRSDNRPPFNSSDFQKLLSVSGDTTP